MKREEWKALATTAQIVDYLLQHFKRISDWETKEKFSDMLTILNDDMNAAFEVQEWEDEESK